MDVVQVLHMNGGMGEFSYATNSLIQEKVIKMTKHITDEALKGLQSNIFRVKNMAIADLGCSSGPNTLLAVSEIIKTVENFCKQQGHESPEYQVFLNDLPGNDFNTIFRSFSSFNKENGNDIKQCFFNGVPGSFYGRLFPKKSLHFVHSSYSLQWLSQVPKGLQDNKKNIYMASSSSRDVLNAYHEQFQRDFNVFLKCRSEEIVDGGRMVLTFLGRKSADPSSKECCAIWELLAMALNQMVSEGLIEEETMNGFNIPQYTPSPEEVATQILKEGSFIIDQLEVSYVSWNVYENEYNKIEEFKEDGNSVAKFMRSVAEPLLISHFGEAIIDNIFCRYSKNIAEYATKESGKFVNVTVSRIKQK